MDYLYCMPDLNNTRENCEKIHNILARMSDKYKLNIVPEPVKAKYFGGLDYYKKYRIYKEIREIGGNSAEAYLQADEKEMILSGCKRIQLVNLFKAIHIKAFDNGIMRSKNKSKFPMYHD